MPVLDWMGATVRDLGLALGGMFSFWHGKRVGSLVQTDKQAGVVFRASHVVGCVGVFNSWMCKTMVVVLAWLWLQTSLGHAAMMMSWKG